MTKSINMHDAKTHLSRLADQVNETGESMIIAKAGKPWVMLSPIVVKKVRLGALAGLIEIFDDTTFDGLDEDIQALVYGENWREEQAAEAATK
jgi:antitoxin (DNA-binding transcriptional repressor) of toxin-antitoxin stability system